MFRYIRENRKNLRDIFKFQISYIMSDLEGDLEAYYLDLERHGYATPFDDASVKDLIDIVSDIKDYVNTDIPCNFSFNDKEGKQASELCRFIFEVFKPYFKTMIITLNKPFVLFEVDAIKHGSLDFTTDEIDSLTEIADFIHGFDDLNQYNTFFNNLEDSDKFNYYLTSK